VKITRVEHNIFSWERRIPAGSGEEGNQGSMISIQTKGEYSPEKGGSTFGVRWAGRKG